MYKKTKKLNYKYVTKRMDTYKTYKKRQKKLERIKITRLKGGKAWNSLS